MCGAAPALPPLPEACVGQPPAPPHAHSVTSLPESLPTQPAAPPAPSACILPSLSAPRLQETSAAWKLAQAETVRAEQAAGRAEEIACEADRLAFQASKAMDVE